MLTQLFQDMCHTGFVSKPNTSLLILNNFCRDIFRGTWFIESLCKVFMECAATMDLRDMLDETARMLSEYETEAGTKQSFGYEVNIL